MKRFTKQVASNVVDGDPPIPRMYTLSPPAVYPSPTSVIQTLDIFFPRTISASALPSIVICLFEYLSCGFPSPSTALPITYPVISMDVTASPVKTAVACKPDMSPPRVTSGAVLYPDPPLVILIDLMYPLSSRSAFSSRPKPIACVGFTGVFSLGNV